MMEELASISMAPYVLGVIFILVFLFFGSKKLFTPATELDKLREPDPAKLYAPERTGNFKFVEENPEKFVLYAEYQKWEVEDVLTFGFKKVYWQRATTEDLNYYYDKQMLEKHGRIR
jgi:hypothetical protein